MKRIVFSQMICYDVPKHERMIFMRDIPIFTTEDGVASLILKQIPYREQAYIWVQDVQPEGLDNLIRECVGFCRAAGAEQVFASGHPGLEAYPLHTIIYDMAGEVVCNEPPLGRLWPVTEETVSRWRTIYNERMKGIDNAAALSSFDEKQILESGGAYFVHDGAELWGIGWLEEDRLLAVASVKPGMGQSVLEVLMSVCGSNRLTLEVASTNQRAVRLYESMGFLKTGEKSRWYRVM